MIRQKLTHKGLLLKILKNSIKTKQKAKWSRETGAGFIAEDIKNIQVIQQYQRHKLRIQFNWDMEKENWFEAFPQDLNLRETEEALRWVQDNT